VTDEQVAELRRWALGLAEDPRPELKAAAKAIRLLADDLLAARSQLLEERLIRQALEERDETAPAAVDDVVQTLRHRLRDLVVRRTAVESPSAE
jgi:hypothetical protein